MGLTELLAEQLADPFRIGLIVFLVVTARNTAAATGTALPLILGIVFVAILIPMSFHREAPDLFMRIGVGLLANTVLLAAALALLWIWRQVFTRETPRA